MNDYGSIFARDGDKLRGEFDLINVKGRFNKESFELNKKEESWESLAAETSTKQVWDVNYMWDRYFEDNDTESDSESEEENQIPTQKVSQSLPSQILNVNQRVNWYQNSDLLT